MKLTNMVLLERTLEYNSDEFLQTVQIAKRIIRTGKTSEEKALATLTLAVDRLQKEIYEFWGERLGNKQDLIHSAGITVPSNYTGILVPRLFLTVARHVLLLEQTTVNQIFPPRIAKLIARGKDHFKILFDNANVELGKYSNKYASNVLIATTMDMTEFKEMVTTADTWISLISRVEFYVGLSSAQYFKGSEDVKDDYRASDVTAYVNERISEIMAEKKHDPNVGHEDIQDIDNDFKIAMTIMEMIISECLDLTRTYEAKKVITKIEYEIDPDTKMVKKYKNEHGKMVPVVHFNTIYSGADYRHDNSTTKPVSSSFSKIPTRYEFKPNKKSLMYKEFKDLINDIEQSLSRLLSPMLLDAVWDKKEKLEQTWGDVIDVDYAISTRPRDTFSEEDGEVWELKALKKLRWEHEVLEVLSSNDDAVPYSETNLPKKMIELFQQAEREIVFLAKLLMWL